jgi:uncharacterized HhH-GPD family protein
MKGSLAVTGDNDADHLVNTDPLALLLAMMLDQQVPMEWAFLAPHRLRERLGGTLDASQIASMDEDDLLAVFKGPPALHRFPGSMGKRAHDLSRHLVEHYGGDVAAVWRDARTGDELLARLQALPGFGKEKSQIFLALLAKRFGIRPPGWELAAGPFADDEPRSVADIDSRANFDRVRAFKKVMKAQKKGKGDLPEPPADV